MSESAREPIGTTTGNPESATKACPFCGERILAVARKCKHCNEFLRDPAIAHAPQRFAFDDYTGSGDLRVCPWSS
jgi:hypothetical protein